MNSFAYTRAGDVATAVSEMAKDGPAKFIARGTNLLDLMKENVARPSGADRPGGGGGAARRGVATPDAHGRQPGTAGRGGCRSTGGGRTGHPARA